jgi:hypothetical protein
MYRFGKGELLEFGNGRLRDACVRVVPDGPHHVIAEGAIVRSLHSLAQVDKLYD